MEITASESEPNVSESKESSGDEESAQNAADIWKPTPKQKAILNKQEKNKKKKQGFYQKSQLIIEKPKKGIKQPATKKPVKKSNKSTKPSCSTQVVENNSISNKENEVEAMQIDQILAQPVLHFDFDKLINAPLLKSPIFNINIPRASKRILKISNKDK